MSCACESVNHMRHDDLLVPQGSDWSVFWPTPDMDFTGWTAKAEARATPSSPVRQEWNTAPGATLVLGNVGPDGEAGVLMKFPATMSTAWGWTASVYDILLDGPNADDLIRLTQGNMRVSQAVTT